MNEILDSGKTGIISSSLNLNMHMIGLVFAPITGCY